VIANLFQRGFPNHKTRDYYGRADDMRSIRKLRQEVYVLDFTVSTSPQKIQQEAKNQRCEALNNGSEILGVAERLNQMLLTGGS
jgi:hypothetical protein